MVFWNSVRIMIMMSICKDYDDFLTSKTIQRSSAYSLVLISVSIQRLSDDFKSRCKGTEWSNYEKLEDLIVRRYDNIGKKDLWNTFTEDIPILENYLNNIRMD